MSTEVFDLGSTVLRVLVATEAATVLDGELAPGAGAPFHRHTLEDETIVVLEGELLVDDGSRSTLGPGSAYRLPRGTRHAFVNEGDSTVRALFVCVPGGLENFFRALANGAPPAAAAAEAGLEFEVD
jgi:quercetin dioxygenase-like cupin family protein